MNATFNFTAEEMKRIQSLTEELVNNAQPGRSVQDNVAALLQEHVPSLDEANAAEVARALLKGATDFTARYEELCREPEDGLSLYDRCMAHIADRTPQEQAACILNFIALMQTLDTTVLGEMLAEAGSDVAARFETFRSLNPQVNDALTGEQLEELKERLRDTIEHNAVCVAGDEQMEALVETLDTDPALARTLAEKGLHELDYKAYAALAAYIAWKKGRLASLPEEVDPELLGAGVAAGVERSKVITRARRGWITWEQAFRYLKYLGGALLFVLFAWVNAHLLLLGLGLSCSLLAGLVGSASIGIVAGLLIGGYAMYKALSWFYDAVEEPILDGLGEAYDKVIRFFTESDFIARIREAMHTFWTYVCEKAGQLFKPLNRQADLITVGR